MGFFSKAWKGVKKAVKQTVKVATLGAVDLQKAKDEERKLKQQQAAADAEAKRMEQQAEQTQNRLRQESSDLASLAEQGDNMTGEMAGILTSAEGLDKNKRKLANKKSLGG